MIYLLGGKGFVGSAFARICRLRGLEYTVIDRQNYRELIGSACRLFVNAAGNSRKYLTRQSPLEDFDASVRLVRSSLVDFRFDAYVLVSSADVYPDSSTPASTSEAGELDVATMTAYGFHKYLAEQCVRHAAPRWLILRCGGFVGPLIKKNAIYDILHGGPLWISPDSELQYIHTEQAASIALDLVARGVSNEVLNICGRGVIRLAQVMDWVGRNVVVRPDNTLFRCELDLSKAMSLVELPETERVVREFLAEWRRSGASGETGQPA